jgi:hypothetical protein
MTAGQKLARKLEERLRGTTRYVGTWEDDVGTPGPAPTGNGRASFTVPRLHAPKHRAGDPVVVELPGPPDGELRRWACEVFGVQLPLLVADPAVVRVRAFEPWEDGAASTVRAKAKTAAPRPSQRATCPKCGRVFSVTMAGNIRVHPLLRALGGMQRGDCPGGGKPAPGRAVSLERLRKDAKAEGAS